MKESHDEGVASHIGPESCAVVCKGQGEALTGVRAGRVLSRENYYALTGSSGSRRRRTVRKATADASIARDASAPCAVGDPVARTETPRTGIGRSPGRLRKRERRPHREVQGRKPMMDDQGKSHSSIVPEKSPNKAQGCGGDGGKGAGQREDA